MNNNKPLWQKLHLGTALAVICALGMNAAIGLIMVRSPDGVRMMALYGGATPHSMVANLGQLPTVQVCARRLPA